jgi:hypothetical protein
VALLDGVAEGVVEHRPLAPLGRPGGRPACRSGSWRRRPARAAPSRCPPGRRRAGRRTRSGCSGRPCGHDLAAGPGGCHRPLRRRGANRGAAARRGAAPAAGSPHPAGRDVPGPGRSPARPPHPRAPGPDRPARGRPAAARRDRGLEARPAPADLPADRAHLRPGGRRAGQGRARWAALRPAAGRLRRPARGLHPGQVQGLQHVAGGGLDRPGVVFPAPAARHQRLRRPRGVLGAPQEQPAAQRGRAVLRLLPVRRGHDGRGERAGRPRVRPPRRAVVGPARPGPRLRPRAGRDARPGIPLGDILADCGYAHRDAAAWAIPLRAAGARLVQDLHPHDRGPKGTHEGAIISNGNLYCPGRPGRCWS